MKAAKARYALAAALLFGISTPVAKLLLKQDTPFLVAALLYLGSGIGLSLWFLSRCIFTKVTLRSVSIKGRQWLYLGGAVLIGGGLAPVLLMLGLSQIPSSTASLLLNLEGAFTAAIACLVFREYYGRRLILGMALILIGGALLSQSEGAAGGGNFIGMLFIVGACVGWAIDNNLTSQISSLDPMLLAMIKGLVAGGVNLVLALTIGQKMPNVGNAMKVMSLGFVSYGLSLVCFIVSLRRIGTARSSAYFSTAPFVGALLSLIIFREPISAMLIVSGALMSFGVWLHLTERHKHLHNHEALEHEHEHVHDEHHQHEHSPNDPPGEPHSHPHRHKPMVHSHPHEHNDGHHAHAH